MDDEMLKYGPEFATVTGWIAELGSDAYLHRWGGTSWEITNSYVFNDSPSLLVTLDLNDPRLEDIRITGANELPLCSYVNSDAWLSTQVFQIDPVSRLVIMSGNQITQPHLLEDEDRFPNPLPEKRLILRPMTSDELPKDEDSYWKACDSFLGGSAFIRIAGPPIWLQYAEAHICDCGLPLRYVCSLGYENYDQPGGFISNRSFFLGETALYFFLCKTCLKVMVTSQPS